MTPPEQRKQGIGDKGGGPADHGGAMRRSPRPIPENNRIQLDMRDYSTHEMGKDGITRDESAPDQDHGAGREAAAAEGNSAASA